MKRKSLLVIAVPLILSSCTANEEDRYTFNHQQGTADYESYMYFNDSFFEKESTIYNPSLATASVSMAMASFASQSEPANYDHRYKNIESLLTDIGFKDFYVNENYKKKPGSDTIGLVFAHKNVLGKELVVMGVRGANYEAEWASNFKLGKREDGYHDGFRSAADEACRELVNYVDSHNFDGDIKVWMAGYSRAGATCNITAGLLDEKISKGDSIFKNNVTLKKEDLYAYTFEAPMGAPSTKNDSGDILVKLDDYNNIFNIVNQNDLVPLVAMKEFGFTRFGIDKYLPDSFTDFDFQKHLNNVIYFYDRISNHNALGDYKISSFTTKSLSGFSFGEDKKSHAWTQGLLLKELISLLTVEGVETIDNYVETIQKGLRYLFELIYESGYFKGSLIDIGLSMIQNISTIKTVEDLVDDVQREPGRFVDDLRPTLMRGLRKLGIEVDTHEFVNNLLSLGTALTKTIIYSLENAKNYLVFSLFSKDNLLSIASGHYPELCQSHIRALDPLYTKDPYVTDMSEKFYKLEVIKDEGLEIVINRNDYPIVSIGDNLEPIDNDVAYRDEGAYYTIYLPYNESYNVKFNMDTFFSLSHYDQIKGDFVEDTKQLDSSFSFEI